MRPELAAELVRLKVDVIVAPATQNVRAAQQASRTIPIVMAGSSNPVADGIVASLARPGGNVTGLSMVGERLAGKQLELLKETNPRRCASRGLRESDQRSVSRLGARGEGRGADARCGPRRPRGAGA